MLLLKKKFRLLNDTFELWCNSDTLMLVSVKIEMVYTQGKGWRKVTRAPTPFQVLSSDFFWGGGASFWFFLPLFAMYRRILIFLSLGQVYLKYEITTISQEMNLFCTFEYLFKCLNYRLYWIEKKLELFWTFEPAEHVNYFAYVYKQQFSEFSVTCITFSDCVHIEL